MNKPRRSEPATADRGPVKTSLQAGQGWDWLPGVATACSILACYGTLAILTLLSFMGIGIGLHEGAWAGAISAFAVVAALGIAHGWRRHGKAGPAGLAAIGAALILWTMFGEYGRATELAGFAALVAASIWDWRAKRTPRRV